MHPQSNGLAERLVQTIKKTVAMWDKDKETFDTFMARFRLNFSILENREVHHS